MNAIHTIQLPTDKAVWVPGSAHVPYTLHNILDNLYNTALTGMEVDLACCNGLHFHSPADNGMCRYDAALLWYIKPNDSAVGSIQDALSVAFAFKTLSGTGQWYTYI